MSQTWTDDPFSSGNVGQTDLQNIENNLLSLKSNFSGTSAPSNAVAGMHWYDSGTGNKVMKMYLDSSWVAYMHGDSSQKILVYRNTAMDGWSIDSSSATDRVVALKGGSTYTTGGANAGSWTISGLTNNTESAHTHTISTSPDDFSADDVGVGGTYDVSATHNHGGATGSDGDHTHTISSDATWRISAAVFTLQYLDI